MGSGNIPILCLGLSVLVASNMSRSLGYETTPDFEWLDPLLHTAKLTQESLIAANSDFLKEGYLYIMEKLAPKCEETSTLDRAMSLVRKLSDPSLLGSWNRRWCVLSQTPNGIHLLLYKDQSSFSNLQSPCTVLGLENCLKLSSLPTHSKSENAFTITLDKRDLLFYTDKSSDLEDWLEILQSALNLQDAYCHSPLKGLPRQKAMRKDPQSGDPPAQVSSPTAPPMNSTDNAAVVKGILATSENSAMDTTKRRRSLSSSRKNTESVQVMKIKKLDT